MKINKQLIAEEVAHVRKNILKQDILDDTPLNKIIEIRDYCESLTSKSSLLLKTNLLSVYCDDLEMMIKELKDLVEQSDDENYVENNT